MNFRNKYVLAIDQGTTSSRAILFSHQGNIITLAQKTFQQYFPKPGWVEHDPNEIWYTQSSAIKEAMAKADVTDMHIACIGIANQRETTIIWDRETGFPVYNAIVWQDRRTADYCEELKTKGYASLIQQKTGLVIDAYFSATKIRWILDHVKGVRERAERGELCFGTVDSWLVWKLTRGTEFITDITNASRTMLFGIRNPVNKGMLVLSEKLVFLVLRSPYVLSACKARPKLNDCPTLPFRLGRRLYLAVFKSTAF